MLEGPADIVLIDAQLDRSGHLSALAMQAHDLMIVTRVAGQAITDAYACMKRLHYAHGIAQFRVLVNHVQSITDARTAFDNLAGVAGRYLTVSLENAGCIAADARMARALELSRCVVDAFPSTPAARDYRHLAAELQYWPMRHSHIVAAPLGGARDSNSGATRRPTVCAARLNSVTWTRGARCTTLRERSLPKPRF